MSYPPLILDLHWCNSFDFVGVTLGVSEGTGGMRPRVDVSIYLYRWIDR